jgi:PAS domain S-box-containing protein
MRNAEGKKIGFRGIMRDITERKRTEEALREREEKYRILLETMEEGYFEIDLKGTLTFVNDGMCKINRHSRDELMGLNYGQFMDKENAQKVFGIFSQVYKTGQPAKLVEWEITRIPDGAKIFHESSVYLMRNAEGKKIGFRGIMRDITERKRTEEALRRSEERYRTILEDIHEGYFETDLEGNFTFVNDATCRNLGYSRDELMGMNNRQYTDKENAKKVFEAFTKLYRTGEPVRDLDYEVIRKDGMKAFSELSASLIRNSEGKPIGFRGISRDVTERKRTEEALREREEKYRTLLETMEEGYSEVDLKGNQTSANDALCKMVRTSRDQLIGVNNREFMDPENAEKAFKVYNQVYKTGQPMKLFEFEITRRGDGAKIYLESSVYLMRNAQGKPIGFRSILRDITERKKVEAALQSAHRRLQDIVEFLPDATFVVDKDRKVIAWNRAIEEMTGMNKNDLIGQGDSSYALPFYGKKSPMLIDLIFPENQAAASLFPGLQKKEGKLYLEGAFPSVFSGKGAFLWAVASPLLDSAGNLAGAIQSLRDITDQKSANARLMQSEKMASIGQLAAGVAHEINNPTAFVSSNLGTLGQYITDLISLMRQYRELLTVIQNDGKDGRLSAKMEQILALEKEVDIDYVLDDVYSLVEESQEGTERIKKIVMDLKDFAHPGEDQLKPADINKNLDSTLNVVWNELKHKATVRREYGAIPPIPCIPQQLNQVFLNLLVNAAQAIPEKGEICIRTQSENGYVEIQISDTGEGIPPENLPKIFDPFFTTKDVGKGTGLGLHVAYSIVKRHNGTIDVKSEVGKGTTFTVRLPLGS